MRLGTFLAIIFLFTTFCSSQASGGGAIQGTVNDSSGAAIPGAKLIILHIDTGQTISLVSNGEGYFTTPSLNIGKYRVRIEAPGMRAWEQDVLIETGKTVDLEPQLSV